MACLLEWLLALFCQSCCCFRSLVFGLFSVAAAAAAVVAVGLAVLLGEVGLSPRRGWWARLVGI